MTRRSDASAQQARAPAFPAIPPADVLGRLAALQTLPTSDLKRQWRELFGKEPPPFNRPYLQSRLAYRIQELAYRGLKPETRARLEALGEQLDGGNIVLRRIRADSRPLPGTRLVREWQGVQHVVTVRADDQAVTLTVLAMDDLRVDRIRLTHEPVEDEPGEAGEAA